jgi:cytochrome c5
MNKALHILVFIIFVVAVSCDNKKGMIEPTKEPLSANACDSIRYSNGVKAVIDNNCVMCHGGVFASGGVDLTTYANVKAKALDGRLKDRITNSNNPMPPSGLMKQAKIDSIICWIDKGAPQ